MTKAEIDKIRKKAIDTRRKEIELADEWIEQELIDLKNFMDDNYTYMAGKDKKKKRDKRAIIKRINNYQKDLSDRLREKLEIVKGKDGAWVKVAGFYWYQRLEFYFRDFKKGLNKSLFGDNFVLYNRDIVTLMNKFRSLCMTEEAMYRNIYRNQLELEKLKDEDAVWEYCAILDERTCPRCESYDTRVFINGEGAIYIPQHPLCRCFYIYYKKGDNQEEVAAMRSALTNPWY